MRCFKIRKKLATYQSKGMLPQEKEVITKHLLHCSDCRKIYQQFERLYTLLDKFPSLTVPEDFTEKIIEVLNRRQMEKVGKESFFSILERFVSTNLSTSLVTPFAIIIILCTILLRSYFGLTIPLRQEPSVKPVEDPFIATSYNTILVLILNY